MALRFFTRAALGLVLAASAVAHAGGDLYPFAGGEAAYEPTRLTIRQAGKETAITSADAPLNRAGDFAANGSAVFWTNEGEWILIVKDGPLVRGHLRGPTTGASVYQNGAGDHFVGFVGVRKTIDSEESFVQAFQIASGGMTLKTAAIAGFDPQLDDPGFSPSVEWQRWAPNAWDAENGRFHILSSFAANAEAPTTPSTPIALPAPKPPTPRLGRIYEALRAPGSDLSTPDVFVEDVGGQGAFRVIFDDGAVAAEYRVDARRAEKTGATVLTVRAPDGRRLSVPGYVEKWELPSAPICGGFGV